MLVCELEFVGGDRRDSDWVSGTGMRYGEGMLDGKDGVDGYVMVTWGLGSTAA